MTGKEIISAATDVGFALLRYGAEIYRVEQSVMYICKAYGASEVHVFAVHSTLFVSAVMDGEEYATKIRRTFVTDSNLEKVDLLNDLSRTICKEKPELWQIKQRLKMIEQKPSHPRWLIDVAGFIAGFFFCLFFKGTFLDALCAGIIGFLLEELLFYLDRLESNGFIRATFGAIFCTAVSKLSVLIGLGQHYDLVNIGALMLLVPGLALTISMRDFLASDYISGIAKLAEALMTAVCIAVGVTVVLMIW